MTDSRRFDLVIIGAGIAGSALALELAGHGFAIALVEARPMQAAAAASLKESTGPGDFDLRVSSITPRSRAQLERLGAWRAIEQRRYCPYRRMVVWDAEGTGELTFDCREVDSPALGYIVENREINGALHRRLSESPDITLLCPATLVACESGPGDGMRLTLEGGEVLEAGLLVAADGALSRVRDMLDFSTREWDYGHRAMVATVALGQSHGDTAWQRFLPTGPLAFLPLPGVAGGHYCSIVWSATESLSERLMGLEAGPFCEELGAALEHRIGPVLECSDRVAFPLRQRHAVDYIRAGVALVGDAAHTIHPLAGQGINLGLADVAVLAQELLRARRLGLAPGRRDVLARYQRRRKGENLLMMGAMEGFKRLFEQQAPPLRWLRNAGMRGVASLGPVKHELMRHAMGIRVPPGGG